LKIITTLSLFVSLTNSSLSFADSDSRKEAENMLDMLGMESTLEQSIDQTLNIQLQQNPALVPYRDVMKKFFQKHMSYQSLKPDMVNIYAESFTASELREIIAFYSTPTGRKTIDQMPKLMSKGGRIGAKRVEDNIQELQQMIQDEAARIQKTQAQ